MKEFLELSTGPVPSSHIVATNLDTYCIDQRSDACAIWLRGDPSPRYYAHGTADAEAIAAWAEAQLIDDFLKLPPSHYFATGEIAATSFDGPEVAVRLYGIGLPWAFPLRSTASEALLCWVSVRMTEQFVADSGDDTERRPAVLR